MKGRLILLILVVLAGVAIGYFLMGSRGEPAGEKGPELVEKTVDKPDPEHRSILPEKFPEHPDESKAPETAEPAKSKFAMTIEKEPALSGVDFTIATDDDRKRAGVTSQYGSGVVVTHIHPDSSAAEVAMEVGDVIVRAQKENVNSVEDLRRIVGDRDHTVVNFMRQGQLLSVVLQKPFVPKPQTP